MMLYFNEKIVFKLSPSCVQVENYLTVPYRINSVYSVLIFVLHVPG